ncbi:DUF1330 domain-containing protein [Cognatishimia sp. SS12]|uniref:DUF1330 domain-containing protein n=1 Tax=Cognatishimia sp. SS12 TaxID=2979465 RepID=UPI0023300C56|nr:DUF1330 domain-containing protein [Cognatishimia sp. SS12]MDC0739168.1 DUF1330 domain-containing protein [Cognatishimia sp. SS12]
MPTYAQVSIYLKDPEIFENYRTLAGPAMAKHGATPLAVSHSASVIEGTEAAPDVSVILEFPDRAHAEAWINDPEIAHVHALRNQAADSRIILM